jgi:hypothetical protein
MSAAVAPPGHRRNSTFLPLHPIDSIGAQSISSVHNGLQRMASSFAKALVWTLSQEFVENVTIRDAPFCAAMI